MDLGDQIAEVVGLGHPTAQEAVGVPESLGEFAIGFLRSRASSTGR